MWEFLISSLFFFVSSKQTPTCTPPSPSIIIIITRYYYYYYLIESILLLSQLSFFMNHHSGDRHVRMLLFGLLNGLGQRLQRPGAATRWQHRAEGWSVWGGEEGRMVELNEKLKEEAQRTKKDKNAGFTVIVIRVILLLGVGMRIRRSKMTLWGCDK